ncbi:hypothetical protein AAF712_006416 [Marasmius tenuissimus]|uniref:Uncharacterized protein n=1 Tax=Marasmius tenuissimus TaxID=585030 RepID=A0ABR3A227_9AGAR
MSTASPAAPVTTFENANGTTENKPTPSLPKAKLSALHRFKALTGSAFGSSSSSDASPNFPPSSWSLSQSPDTGSGASTWSDDVEKWRQELERWKTGLNKSSTPTTPEATTSNHPDVMEEEATSGSKGKNKADDAGDSDGKDAAEPSTLAMRIKAIIDENLPFTSTPKTPAKAESHSEPSTPGPSSSASQSNTPMGSLTPKTETNATTPGTSNGSMFNFAVDSKLAKLLSSETIMNGGAEKGKESVWAILDRLGYGQKDAKGKEKDPGPHSEIEEDGIMFYSPLQPTTELSPEIAESIISEDDSTTSLPLPKSPLGQPPISALPEDEPSTPKPKQKRVFQPSATQLSFQCTWWGYRLFLPPPVMAQLSNAHVAAAKRGAMITAALKWIIDKAPVMMVPPTLRPAMLLLRSFSPYLGYVGAFVAWSWTRVESKDVGNGVVLTATWLLPIAILPASWDFEAHGTPVDPAISAGEASSRVAAAGTSSGAKAATDTKGKKDVPDATSTGVSTGKGKESARDDSTNFTSRREPRLNRTTSAPGSSGAGAKARSQPSHAPSLTRSKSGRANPSEETDTLRPPGIQATTSTDSATSGKSNTGRTLRTPWGRVKVKDQSQRTPKSTKSTLRNLP